jgi:hypothetical protein
MFCTIDLIHVCFAWHRLACICCWHVCSLLLIIHDSGCACVACAGSACVSAQACKWTVAVHRAVNHCLMYFVSLLSRLCMLVMLMTAFLYVSSCDETQPVHFEDCRLMQLCQSSLLCRNCNSLPCSAHNCHVLLCLGSFVLHGAWAESSMP